MPRTGPDWRRVAGRFALVAAFLGVALFAVAIVRYVVTDRGYSRLSNVDARTRTEVARALQGFTSQEITDSNEMNPAFKKHMSPGRHYIRYTILGSSDGIDVIYESDGRLVAYWPQYE